MDQTRTTAPSTPLAAALALAALLAATPAFALDVRQHDGALPYQSDLGRAFVPCTAPNTVTLDGKPACAPAVTSVCKYNHSNLHLRGDSRSAPSGRMTMWTTTSPAICDSEEYVIETGLRYSGDFSAAGVEAPCPSGRCTFPDRVASFDQLGLSAVLTLTGGDADVPKGNFEIRGLTVFGPDGLPMVAPGIDEHPLALRFFGNLTVPIEPCTSGPVCDLAPWTSPCDFESGEVEITRAAYTNAGLARVRMRNVTGTSPLCQSGIYHLEATVRGTVKGCGNPVDLCTLPDTTVTIPLPVDGRDIDAGGPLLFASHPNLRYASTQILGVRVIDPTGLPVAAVGVAGPTVLPEPRVTVKGDALRVRTTIPIGGPDVRIDPAADPGLTVTVSDRDGVVYTVTIPDVRWQLQPPLGSRWTYADQNGVLNGVRKARVKRLVKKGVTHGYDVDLQAAGVDLSAADRASLTVNVTAPVFVDVLGVDDLFEWQGTRTCKGTYPKLTCK